STRLRVSHAFHSPLMEPMLAEFRAVARSLSYSAPVIPVVSTLTGRLTEPGDLADPEYWVRHVRHAVRFADAVTTLAERGVVAYLEVGPDAILTGLAPVCLPADSDATFLATQRRDHDEAATLAVAVARLHVGGVAVDWTPWCPGRRVELPTYPFQRERYWLRGSRAAGDVSTLGQADPGHPLLGAAVDLPDGGAVLTGRLSAADQPWLAGNRVHGVALLPEAGLVGLALTAARHVGAAAVGELVVDQPLVLAERTHLALRLVVTPEEPGGLRSVTISSRVEGAEGGWLRHATGTLTTDGPSSALVPVTWPPHGATPIEIDDLATALAGLGHEQAAAGVVLTAAWRRGAEVFAELAVPAGAVGAPLDAASLDAALHPHRLAGGGGQAYRWTGVAAHAVGATDLRVHLAPGDADTLRLTVTDAAGAPVLTAESVATRAYDPAQLAVPDTGTLLRLDWLPATGGAAAELTGDWTVLGPDVLALGDEAPAHPDLTSLTAALGAQPPRYVVTALPAVTGQVPADVAATTGATHALLRSWLAEDRLALTTLVVVVRAGTAATALPTAAARGLLRAAQAEHPGRFLVVELAPDLAPGTETAAAVRAAVGAGEPETAVRGETVLVPRLTDVPDTAGPRPVLGAGTALVVGGTVGVGALLARHLVGAHGFRHLLLTGNADVPALAAEITALGATADVGVGDPRDPAVIAGLLAGVPGDQPVTCVVLALPAAGNGLIATRTPDEVVDTVSGTVDVAWHLHDLTRKLALDAFVLCGDSAGVLHGAGRGGTAAASTFLDGLARHRRALGLPGVALAFGPVEPAGDDLYRDRLHRLGLPSLTAAEVTAAFDAALAAEEPALLPLRLHRPTLRAAATELPAVLLGIGGVRQPARDDVAGGQALRRRYLAMSAGARTDALLDLVRGHVAAVLGHAGGDAVPPDRPFKELGFDSLAGVELRRRLGAALGLELPATLVFDHPTARAAAAFVDAELGTGTDDGEPALLHTIDELGAALTALAPEERHRELITTRLEALLRGWRDRAGDTGLSDDYLNATDDELFELIDGELGLS
ncbi:KR domain-containing protein, partial [Micromonospora sp. CPCC 205711]|uniref:KR domain-containing protein n=1 Tax=Micromonospora sp. CPCC 205547 TaxID=3122400 RepID=UPI002FF0AECE